jgi:preprotein translocase subunit SecE
MGRIQKKKTTGVKKKKKQQNDQGISTQPKATGAPAKGMAPSADKSKGAVGKKNVLPLKKQPTASASVSARPKDNFLTKTAQFLREVKVELKKVTWPSRKQTLGSTVVVIVLVMIISFFLGVVDMGLSSLIRVVLQ